MVTVPVPGLQIYNELIGCAGNLLAKLKPSCPFYYFISAATTATMSNGTDATLDFDQYRPVSEIKTTRTHTSLNWRLLRTKLQAQ
jgi:hypothetical protein